MKIGFIGCWYVKDMYSHHLHTLIDGLNYKNELKVELITSNCNCFSSAQKYSIAKNELLNLDCNIIKLPYAPVEPNKNYGLFKYYLVKYLKLNFFLETIRGILFFLKTLKYDIIHFDQVLRSFGFISFSVLLTLSRLSRKKIVITVHELDPVQSKYNKLNRLYNKTDKIIVFSKDMGDVLKNLSVDENKIEIIPYAIKPGIIDEYDKDQFIYFGGHNLLKGKGYDTLLGAMKILARQNIKFKIFIYTGEGCNGLEDGKKEAKGMDLEPYIQWSDFLFGKALDEQYQRSIACLIPYTGGSGRHPATCAMSNGIPVIATSKAGLPEYLGEEGIFIKENSSAELAESMIDLINNPTRGTSIGNHLRTRAENIFHQNVVVNKMVQMYNGLNK
jgi:glycosyltransferase involved in cell wall biosynthesis